MTDAVDLRPSTTAKRILEVLLLAAVLGAGAYLRFHNLAFTPGYYSDEGTLLNIAQHLREGRWQYMALGQSTLLVARMPLFPLLLASVSSILGEGILTLRLLTASLGTIAVLGVFVLAGQLGGRKLAYLSAVILAIHPMAVIYGRIGFSYNLLAVLSLVIGMATIRFMRSESPRTMLWAGLLTGIGVTSDLLMAVYAVPLFLAASTRGRKATGALMLGTGIPILAYAAYMMAQAPEAFMFDLRFTFSRLSSIPVVAQFPVAALNFARLLELDHWFAPAIVGVFVISPPRNRWFLVLMFILPLLLISRSVTGLAGLGYYYLIPVLPYVAIGIAGLLLAALPRVHGTLDTGARQLLESWGWNPSGGAMRWLTARVVALSIALGLFVLVLSPFVISGMTTVIGINGTLSTPIDFLLVSPEAAASAAEYVNERVAPNELVIASPAVAWLIEGQVSDFQLSLAAVGKETLHLPEHIPGDRFEYSVDPESARFVIVDGIWHNWAAVVMPEVARTLELVETWPIVHEAEGVGVHLRPGGIGDY